MKPEIENAPAANRGVNQSKSNNLSISPLETILGKLDGARPSGDGWRADCPNGHSSRNTLAIKQADELARDCSLPRIDSFLDRLQAATNTVVHIRKAVAAENTTGHGTG